MTVIVSGGIQRSVRQKRPWPPGQQRTKGPHRGFIELYGDRAATYEGMVFSQPWVYAAVRTFWLVFIGLSEKVYSGADGDDRRRDRSSSLALLLASPWKGFSDVDRRGELVRNLFSQGNHLELIVQGAETRSGYELVPIPWGLVQLVTDDHGTIGYNVRIEGTNYPLLPENVVHYRLMGGRSPLEPLRRTLAIEDAALDWSLQSFEKGPSLRGAFTTEKLLQDRTIPRLRSELKDLYSGPEGERFGIFDQGLDFKSLTQSAVDAGIKDQRILSREEVAAAYGIPGPVVGILDHATYSNVTQLIRFFGQFNVMPYLKLVEASLRTQLIAPNPWWDGLMVEYDMRDLLRGDPESEARAHLMNQQSGTNAANERRKYSNLPAKAAPGYGVDDAENPYNLPLQPVNLAVPGQPAGGEPDPVTQALLLDAVKGGERTHESEAPDA